MEVSPDSTTETLHIYDYINNFLMTPAVFIILVVVIVGYILLFISLGKSNENNSESSSSGFFSGSEESQNSSNKSKSKIFSIIIIGLLVVFVVINAIQYFLGINIIASVKNLVKGNPEVDIKVNQIQNQINNAPVPEIKFRNQVFNIPGNYYGYNDAKALCSAYGARLATYNEVEDSYNNGAEWCNYGWSDNQMALFPTQKETYEKLQKIQGHEHDCGRPGVNGGYIANPSVQFGVNCYGHKPRITDEEEDMMRNSSQYPKTAKDIAMEQRVNYWKGQLNNILVSPFNSEQWSRL